MSFVWLAKKVVESKGYKFTQEHRKFIMIVEGLIVIGLLLGVWLYFYQDWQVKKQIRDKCGFENDNWQCVCTKSAVDFYKAEQANNLSLFLNANKNLAIQNVKVDR